MAWSERRGSWDYNGQEEDRQISSHGQKHPHGEYPYYEQRTKSREYNRSYSDYQSEGPRDERTHRHPPHGSNNESTGYRHQNYRGSHAYPRNYGRYDSGNDSTAYPRDQDSYMHSPPHYYQPRRYPQQSRESDGDHYSSHYNREEGHQAYPPPQSYQGREFFRQRDSQPRFNNRDRGRYTRDFRNYSPRYNANSEHSPIKTDGQEFDYSPETHKDEQTQKFSNSPLDRQRSEPFYPLSRLPKARSRCSSTGSEQSKSRDDCVICYGTVTHLAITPCEHSYCHLCCLRLQILCDDHHCPICRTPFEEDKPLISIHNPTSTLLYKDLVATSRPCDEYSLGLIPPLTKRFVDDLFNLKCPVDECQFSPRYNNFYHLEKHLKFVHEQYYCHICLTGLKQFVFEMRLYSREELNMHKDGKGDSRLDPPGHKGHPMCRFCRERSLDETALYEHLHQNHFWCYICERSGIHMYYQNQEELRSHFKKEHFLCDRGECRNEVFTSVFSSNIDLKAHISSVHAGDLKKGEARNLRRVDLEFNYGHSSHQTGGEQEYRERRQPRERRTQERRGNERLEQASDEDEMNADSFEPTIESNKTENAFENEASNSNLNPDREPENKDPNMGMCNDEKNAVSNESEADILEPSTDTSTKNWPQVGEKSVPIATNQKSTPDVPIPGPTDVVPTALLYSKSLGLVSQSIPLRKQPPKVKASQPPPASPYSDALKPESQRAQKLQSQNQDSSQEPTKQPPKQTYEDIFPALCSPNIPPIPSHPDKPAQTPQPNSSVFPHAKTGKKSNKQRKKDYNKSNQALTAKPNTTPSSNSNDTVNYSTASKQPPKGEHTSQPTLTPLENTKAKSKKQLSPSRKLNSTQQNDSKKETGFEWVPPRHYKQRKTALNSHIHAMSKTNPFILDYESKYKSLLDRSVTAREFFQYCVNAFGLNFSKCFPEILVLIPEVSLQQELLHAKDRLYPSAIFLAFAPSSSSWSNQAHIQLETCPVCSQVLLPSDLLLHNNSHSTDNEFPALC